MSTAPPTKRMSAETWTFLNKNFPKDMAKISCVEIEANSFDLFKGKLYRRRWKKKKTKTTKPKTNHDRFNDKLATILDWIDANLNDLYFAKTKNDEDQISSGKTIIMFYFLDETDAVAFKIMFAE